MLTWFLNRYTLIPPRGYTIAGIYGHMGGWVESFGLLIAR
jgi:hypothetical protein